MKTEKNNSQQTRRISVQSGGGNLFRDCEVTHKPSLTSPADTKSLASKFQYQLIIAFPKEIKRKVWVEEDVALAKKRILERIENDKIGGEWISKKKAKQIINEEIGDFSGEEK